jgi:hypothetical protein
LTFVNHFLRLHVEKLLFVADSVYKLLTESTINGLFSTWNLMEWLTHSGILVDIGQIFGQSGKPNIAGPTLNLLPHSSAGSRGEPLLLRYTQMRD